MLVSVTMAMVRCGDGRGDGAGACGECDGDDECGESDRAGVVTMGGDGEGECGEREGECGESNGAVW